MDYKERISDLINSIDDVGLLKFVYEFMSGLVDGLRAWCQSSDQLFSDHEEIDADI